MKRRCCDPTVPNYKRYGGRGIKICDEWLRSFKAFSAWALENGYAEGLTIDRLDNDGNYSPENCRWVTHRDQNRNYSRNHKVTYNGKTMCLAEWAEEFGLEPSTVSARIKRGWSVEEALSLDTSNHGNQRLFDKIKRLQNEVKRCRNELCLKCGCYKESHIGACDDCRFRHDGEWRDDLQ